MRLSKSPIGRQLDRFLPSVEDNPPIYPPRLPSGVLAAPCSRPLGRSASKNRPDEGCRRPAGRSFPTVGRTSPFLEYERQARRKATIGESRRPVSRFEPLRGFPEGSKKEAVGPPQDLASRAEWS
jgi:hypothetical protein